MALLTWLVPVNKVSYELQFSFALIALICLVIGTGLICHTCWKYWKGAKHVNIRTLRIEALDLSAKLRALQERIERDHCRISDRYGWTWQRDLTEEQRDTRINARNSDETNARAIHTAEFHRLLPHIRFVKGRFLEILPSYTKDSTDNYAEEIIECGMIVGIRPLDEIANYMERLVRLLPND